MKLDRIVVDPEVCLGQPTVKGTRITVAFVLKLLAAGMDISAVTRAYPELAEEDVRQSLAYAAWLAAGETRPFPSEALGS